MMTFFCSSGDYLIIYPYLCTMSKMDDVFTILLRNFVLSGLFQDMDWHLCLFSKVT